MSIKSGILYKKIVRKLERFFKLNSIFSIEKDYDRYLSAFKKGSTTDDIIEFAMKEAGSEPVFARVQTSDLVVLADTFLGKYHVPIDDCRPVRTILDLGCNVGYTLRHYAFLYPDANLYGVEMDADNCRLALMNTKHLTQCTIANYAVWNEDTSVSYSGADAESFHISRSAGVKAEARTICTLMNIFGIHSVDLLKMDIEGAEEEIFSGNTDWLKSVNSIILEVHKGNLDLYFSKLRQEGFECREHSRHWSSIWARKS